jgi:hypothetical protein
MRPISRISNKEKMNKMERTKHGRGPALVMGLAIMHCVRKCICVFMLRSCNSAVI